MIPDTARAATWAQRLVADPAGGWGALWAEVLAADPDRLERVAAEVRWAIEVECHHCPDVQEAALARLTAELDGRHPGPPVPTERGVPNRSGAAGLIATRTALTQQLSALVACLNPPGGQA